jgi:copper chaperone NosL
VSVIDKVLGPKVDATELAEHQGRYRLPKALFAAAALVLGVSIFLPYWHLRLTAPQFPDGLYVTAYVNRLEGGNDNKDLDELEGLNHYVGLPSFEDGAVLERTVSVAGILVLGGLLLAGLFVHSRWVLLFVAPALIFPVFFLADLQYWLWNYGHSLDPTAALSSAVGEFTPPLFGPGEIAQFETLAWPGLGLVLAFIAAVLTAVGLWAHRRAYKPIVDAQRARESEAEGPGSRDAELEST